MFLRLVTAVQSPLSACVFGYQSKYNVFKLSLNIKNFVINFLVIVVQEIMPNIHKYKNNILFYQVSATLMNYDFVLENEADIE